MFNQLLKAGKSAVAAVRDPENLTNTPAVAVDFASIDSLAAAYRDAEGVFVHLPLGSGEDRMKYAQNIAEAIGQAKPRRVVISTSGSVIDEPGTPRQAPGNSAVSMLIRGAEKSGVSMAVIAPRLYLENLLLPVVLDHAKQEGILRYPLREDYPVSWSSHLDVADVAADLYFFVTNRDHHCIIHHSCKDAFLIYQGKKLDKRDKINRGNMNIQQIRNATLVVQYAGKKFLIDPMLGEKGSFPPFPNSLRQHDSPNPLVELPIPAEEVIEGTDAVFFSHLHIDHWDDAAKELLPKEVKIFVQEALDQHKPEIIVVNGGDNQFVQGGSLIMGKDDIYEVYKAAPEAKIVVSHMEAVNHYTLSREELKSFIEEKGMASSVLVPVDGESCTF